MEMEICSPKPDGFVNRHLYSPDWVLILGRQKAICLLEKAISGCMVCPLAFLYGIRVFCGKDISQYRDFYVTVCNAILFFMEPDGKSNGTDP